MGIENYDWNDLQEIYMSLSDIRKKDVRHAFMVYRSQHMAAHPALYQSLLLHDCLSKNILSWESAAEEYEEAIVAQDLMQGD